MNNRCQRTFTFMVPSVLLLDWLYEFHCSVEDPEAQPIVVNIQEDTVGSVQVRIQNPGARWKTWLYVWEKCHILALNHAFRQNTQDDMHRSKYTSLGQLVQE